MRYVVNAAGGSDELNGPLRSVANATPYLFDEPTLRRGASGCASSRANGYMPIRGHAVARDRQPGNRGRGREHEHAEREQNPAVPQVATRRQGTSFSAAISAATNAIQPTLMIPSAKSDAMSAQQQPTHQAPCAAPIRSAPAFPPRHEVRRNPSGLRHLREAHVLERRQLVDRRDDERRPGHPAAGAVPGEDAARERGRPRRRAAKTTSPPAAHVTR